MDFDFRSYCQGVLAGQPDAVVIADSLLHVAFAEGRDLAPLGIGSGQPLTGRPLSDVFPVGETWAGLQDCLAAGIAGRSSTLNIASSVGAYRVAVSPLGNPGYQGVAVVLQRGGASTGSEHGTDDRGFLAAAFDHAPVGMSVIGPHGGWLRVNDEYCRMLGYERPELLTKTYRDLTHPDDIAADAEWLNGDPAGGDVRDLERRYNARDGSTLLVHARSERVRADDGGVAYTVTILRDITEQRAAHAALSASERLLRSIIDNTPNAISVQGRDQAYEMVNRAFVQRFELITGLPLQDQHVSDVLPADLISLDREDHERVLQTGETIEREDVVPRPGEDRVYQTLKFPMGEAPGTVTAVCTIYTDVTERRFREAALNERLEWSDRLHDAAAQDHFVLFGQPIVDLGSGRIEQAELLVRMKDRRKGGSSLILPGQFLPTAERLGLAAVVDQWVVARAVQLALDHRVEVNISAQTISDPEQVARLVRLVAESGAPPSNIIFEITETAVAENIGSARAFASRMQEIGCSFALDDFGTGFGTFTYLKHLPVDYLKIDIEFVRDLIENEGDRQVVRAIVGVAKEYGMKTVAEGVEDQATLNLLAGLNVDYAQGYWIGRPAPIDEMWPDAI